MNVLSAGENRDEPESQPVGNPRVGNVCAALKLRRRRTAPEHATLQFDGAHPRNVLPYAEEQIVTPFTISGNPERIAVEIDRHVLDRRPMHGH